MCLYTMYGAMRKLGKERTRNPGDEGFRLQHIILSVLPSTFILAIISYKEWGVLPGIHYSMSSSTLNK